MDKPTIRKTILHALENIESAEKAQIEAQLHRYLFQSPMWEQAKTVGITLAQGLEWNTKPIIEKGWSEEKTICLPRCLPKSKALNFYRLDHYDELELSYFNLLEPIPQESHLMCKMNIDLLIVPGVVFNKHGYRIGFGGGYYDRFLTNFPNQTVSLVHSMQLLERIPVEYHDIPVQHLITEKGLIK
ncbi:5-formyltetrahydrofolate cyclo-ligase [Virgibacillus soli]|uniref:5-formyltetrahydrofolate cyclo-ligase n=1 Tax=Paracerasibacillus soli TaxID=480284 RepID=UPI0035ECA5CD